MSSDEFMPTLQTAKQREFEARIKEYGKEQARHQGMSRRAFFKTAGHGGGLCRHERDLRSTV